MNPIIFVVVLYEVLSVVGIGFYLNRKRKKESGGGFSNANQSLSVPVIGVTLALTFLGSLHVFGVMELSSQLGLASIWVSVAHVILICLICATTGRWVRRFGVATVPELLEMLFGRRIRIATSCANAACVFGLLTMEAQCIGIVFASLTGCSIVQGAVIGGIIGMLYVLLAGMEQIALVNVLNTVVMYGGLAFCGLKLGGYIPGGWEHVENFYVTNGLTDMLKVLGTKEVILAFGIPTVLATIFCQGISQMGLQVCMSAKSEKVVFRSMIIGAGLNGLFTIFTVAVGLAANSIPELSALGPKSAGPALIAGYLPSWLVAWLCASFLGALLSTFATNVMAPATLFVKDIYVATANPNAPEALQTKYIRRMIVILSILAIGVSFFLPEIVSGANWMFSWLIPVFWITIYGLFWKRSKKAAEIILFGSWIVNFFWSFTPLPAMLGMEHVMNAYVMLALSLVLGVIANVVIAGEAPLLKRAGTNSSLAEGIGG